MAMSLSLPTFARRSVRKLNVDIASPEPMDWDSLREFSQRYREVMVWSHINDSSKMTFRKARKRAYEYILVLESLYESEQSIDEQFVNGRSRREQGLILLQLLDGCFEAMQNLGDGAPGWLHKMRGQVAHMHNERWQRERPKGS